MPEQTQTPGPHDVERNTLPKGAWTITALVVVFMVLNYADKSVLGFAADDIMDELGISKSAYGAIASSFYFLFSVSGLIVGFVSTRVSTRVLLAVMACLWAVAQVPVFAFAAVPTLFFSRILLGASEGPAAPISMHALYKWFPDQRRGLPSALQISGAALGTLIAAPVVTWIISAFGWRAAFVLLAVLSLAWGLIWMVKGHDGPYDESATPKPRHPETDQHTGNGQSGRQRSGRASTGWGLYRTLLLNRTVIGSVSSALGAHWALALASAWLPTYLKNDLDMTPGHAAIMVSSTSGLAFIALLSVSSVVDAMKRRGATSRSSSGVIQGIAVLVAGTAMASIPVVGAGPLQLALVIIAFGIHAVSIPLHYWTTSEVVRTRQRGAVFGIVAALGTLPGLVAPYVMGRLIDAGSTDHAGYVIGLLTTAALMIVFGLIALVTINPERDAARILGRTPAGAAAAAGSASTD